MEVSEWVSKYVKIDTSSGYYYKGTILSCDDNSLTLRDIHNDLIILKLNIITCMRSVPQC